MVGANSVVSPGPPSLLPSLPPAFCASLLYFLLPIDPYLSSLPPSLPSLGHQGRPQAHNSSRHSCTRSWSRSSSVRRHQRRSYLNPPSSSRPPRSPPPAGREGGREGGREQSIGELVFVFVVVVATVEVRDAHAGLCNVGDADPKEGGREGGREGAGAGITYYTEACGCAGVVQSCCFARRRRRGRRRRGGREGGRGVV
jgi:hypothetical protein